MRLLIMLLVGVLLVTPRTVFAQSCALLQGTISAEITSDAGFEGLYKYTLTLDWDVTEFGLSHLDIFLALETCECVCEPGIVAFGNPAGNSNGSTTGDAAGDSCNVDYIGDYVCMGDPSLPPAMAGPAVKWDALDQLGCEPMVSGSGVFCFYTPLPPAPPSQHETAIKHGQGVCTGLLIGTLPTCDCAVQAQVETWGGVKGTYR